MKKKNPIGRAFGIIMLLGFAAFFIWNATRERKFPETPRIREGEKLAGISAHREAAERDTRLIRQLIKEDLSKRRFHFSTVMQASSGHRVLRLDRGDPLHHELLERLDQELAKITSKLGEADSPARSERRINEVSRHFENALLESFKDDEDWNIGIPPTRDGRTQRSGYPDLRLVHQPTDSVFYLDPKLVEQGSWDSTFRSFYFEPKKKSLKINDDAVHLIVGIGAGRAWQPCVGPELGLALTTAQQDPFAAFGGLAMFLIGVIIVGLAVGVGIGALARRWTDHVDKVGAVVAIVIGLTMVVGIYPEISSTLAKWSTTLWA